MAAVGDKHAAFRIYGVDGSVWPIHGPGSEASPVRLEQSSVGELYDAPVDTTYKARVGQPGSMYMGHRYRERQISFNLTSFANTAVEWARIDSNLRKAFSYDEDAVIMCTTELSGARQLRVRLEREPEYREDVDPHARRVARWEYSLIAADPFWESEPNHSEFVFDGMNWYGGSVTVSNPGDVAVWPQWVLTAPAKWILPDVSFRDDAEKNRQVVLPFQPLRRDVLVDTDPVQEMIASSDDALLWAQMSGQFFQNPIPRWTHEEQIPVAVDPLPNLPFVIPDEWRRWVASEIAAWAQRLGVTNVLQRTPDDVAAEIKRIINAATPDWLEALNPALLTELVPSLIANHIRDQWGSIGNMAGATAQVRVQPRWTRPWGMEG